MSPALQALTSRGAKRLHPGVTACGAALPRVGEIWSVGLWLADARSACQGSMHACYGSIHCYGCRRTKGGRVEAYRQGVYSGGVRSGGKAVGSSSPEGEDLLPSSLFSLSRNELKDWKSQQSFSNSLDLSSLRVGAGLWCGGCMVVVVDIATTAIPYRVITGGSGCCSIGWQLLVYVAVTICRRWSVGAVTHIFNRSHFLCSSDHYFIIWTGVKIVDYTL